MEFDWIRWCRECPRVEETLQWVEGAWDSVIAYLEKQQLETYGSDVPFKEEKSAKHTPYITFDESGTASVTVGSEEERYIQ